MDKEKSIVVLNSLVVINNDRIEGYESASKETKDSDLLLLFAHLSQTSVKFKQELVDEIHKLGGKPTEGTTIMGRFFRVWMDVKAAFTKDDRKTILDSCEYGEDTAVEAYNDALKEHDNCISTEQRAMLKAHHALLKIDHDKVKGMRDSVLQNS